MAKKVRTPQESSQDQAAVQMLDRAVFLDIDNAFRRADNIIPCNIGAQGLCCKNCAAGPCRLVGNTLRGVCGATADTIVARNFTRSVASGTRSPLRPRRAAWPIPCLQRLKATPPIFASVIPTSCMRSPAISVSRPKAARPSRLRRTWLSLP